MENGFLFRQFTELRLLASGRIADLYRGVDPETKRTVCLKLMTAVSKADPAERARFLRAAELQSRVVHPNVLPVYDVRTGKEEALIVMKYASGRSLFHRLQTEKTADFSRLISWGKDLCAGLEAIHCAGIIHGDVKPLNLMLDESDRLMISDFGEARTIGEALPVQPQVVINGSPYYMAPECARGYAPTAASDWYSVGVILYRMACGRVPFNGPDAETVMRKHVYEECANPRRFRPDLPPSVAELILNLLKKDPSARPADGKAIAAILSQCDRS